MMTNPPQQPNNLGNASLGLGIASAALVFGIGLCALTGLGQRWLGWSARRSSSAEERVPFSVCSA